MTRKTWIDWKPTPLERLKLMLTREQHYDAEEEQLRVRYKMIGTRMVVTGIDKLPGWDDNYTPRVGYADIRDFSAQLRAGQASRFC